MLRRWWTSLTQCAQEGCDGPPERLGYCSRHVRPYAPAPDEFWGDNEPTGAAEPAQPTGPGVSDERTDLPPAAVG